MLLPLLAVASAADLDLALTIPGRPQMALTLYDVAAGAQPSISVPGVDAGQVVRFGFTLTEHEDSSYTLATTIDEVRVERTGRERVKLVAMPAIQFAAEQEAVFAMGVRMPYGDPNPGRATSVEYRIVATLHE